MLLGQCGEKARVRFYGGDRLGPGGLSEPARLHEEGACWGVYQSSLDPERRMCHVCSEEVLLEMLRV